MKCIWMLTKSYVPLSPHAALYECIFYKDTIKTFIALPYRKMILNIRSYVGLERMQVIRKTWHEESKKNRMDR